MKCEHRLKEISNIIIRRMADFANTPLNKRRNAFDELHELLVEIERKYEK